MATTLGVWQVQRYAWKTGLVENAESRASLGFVDDLASFDSPEARNEKIICRGMYRRPYKEILLGPRHAAPGRLEKVAMAPSGFNVYAVFDVSEGPALFVKRGWIDTRFKNAVEERTPPDEIVELKGIFGKSDAGGRFTPKNTKDHFFSVDVGSFEEVFGVKGPVNALVDRVTEDGPIPFRSLSNSPLAKCASVATQDQFQVLPSHHLGYAATWFSLAGAGTYILRDTFSRHKGIVGALALFYAVVYATQF